jgi:hypothetical protein
MPTMPVILPNNCIEAIKHDSYHCTWKSLSRNRNTYVEAIKHFRCKHNCSLKQAQVAVNYYIAYGNDVTNIASLDEEYPCANGVLILSKDEDNGYTAVFKAAPKVLFNKMKATHEQALKAAFDCLDNP